MTKSRPHDFFMHTLLPADTCLLCNKSIDEIGGKRIIAQQERGVKFVTNLVEDGYRKCSYQAVPLYEDEGIYVLVWGDPEVWTLDVIKRAKALYLDGMRPWFCSICGHRTCDDCGSPMEHPIASDHIHDNGSVSHSPALLPGMCINQKCNNFYKNHV